MVDCTIIHGGWGGVGWGVYDEEHVAQLIDFTPRTIPGFPQPCSYTSALTSAFRWKRAVPAGYNVPHGQRRRVMSVSCGELSVLTAAC